MELYVELIGVSFVSCRMLFILPTASLFGCASTIMGAPNKVSADTFKP